MSRAADAGPGCPRVVVLLLCGAALLVPPAALASERYDPHLRFRTLTTEHFFIHFHQGEQDLARRLARLAEETHDLLVAELGRARSRARTHVILVDQDDQSNGWAMAFPYNVIQLSAAAPAADELIGNTDDWLRMVFIHEYTHVLHLDRAGGLIGGLRYVFGRAPLLFPNQFLPIWQIEGLATWSESELTGLGRTRSGDFREIVGAAARAGAFEPVDRVNGGLVDWPGGNAPYAYGALFHEYLARRFGGRRLAELADATGRRLPYLPIGAFDRAFGDRFAALWRDFRQAMETASAAPAQADRPAPDRQAASNAVPRRLTFDGYAVGAPRWSADGTRLFYSRRTPHEFPALMSVTPGQAPVRLVNRSGGARTAASRDALLFDQFEYVRSVALQSDLYRLDLNDGRVRRLTAGARLLDPDISPDGRRIACIVDERGSAALAILDRSDAAGQPRILAREAETQFRAPRWSPDGRAIAAERRRPGGPFEIVVVDPDAGSIEVVASGRHRHADPEWLPGGGWILFASDRDGGPLDLHAVDRASRRVVRVTTIPGGSRAASVSPDGRAAAFIGYTPDGYDIFSIELPASLDALPDARDEDATHPAPTAPQTPASPLPAADWQEAPYRPWRSLSPRYWTPVVEEDSDRIEAGAATSGADALGRHAYAAELTWGSAGSRPDWRAAYAYDRRRPTLFASASDDRSRFQGADYRDRAFEAGALVRFRRVLRVQTLAASLHVSDEIRDCAAGAGCGPPGRAGVDRRSARGQWVLTTARTYGYSISSEDGATVAAGVEAAREAFGSSGNATTVVAQLRGYPRLGPRHGVLALRAAAAASWGDRAAARRFGAGGAGAEPPGGFGRDAIGLLRGYAEDDVVGAHAAVANVDLRVPIAYIERGAGRWPFFLKAVHAAAFVDAGHAWDGRFDAGDLKVTFGVELSMDAVVGYSLPLTFTTGAAWRRDGSRRLPEGTAVFGRIGRAF